MKTTAESAGGALAGIVLSVCLCVLMVAGTVRALMWMF